MSTAVVAVPNLTHEPKTVAICEHIRDNGRRCGTPAIRGRHFCYYHSRAHSPAPRPGSRNYRSNLPESIESLQITLMHITEALGSGQINDKVAGKLLYAVQLSANFLKMKAAEKSQGAQTKPSPGLTENEGALSQPAVGLSGDLDDVVTEIPPAMEEVLAVQTAPPPPPPAEEELKPLDATFDLPDNDPETPVTNDEAHRLLLPPRLLVKYLEYFHDADRASPRYQRIERRVALHRRAYRILDSQGLIPDYLDEMAAAGVLATRRREARERAEARLIRGKSS